MNPAPNQDAKFEQLLEYLRQSRGFDFTGYKRPSLMRRVEQRMQAVKIRNFGDYVDYLEVHPEEFAFLFNTILINVTSFFRDQAAWSYLAETVVPRIIGSKANDKSIRIWSAGCATGEEAYSIAIVMAEALGKDEFRKRVKIYATDADEDALLVARQGTYTAKEVQPVAEELRKKYFERVGGRYVFYPDLRRAVIFGRHDLIHDAPMSRLDLLVCRNLLMYFNTETQGNVLARFNYALNPDGYLFLGQAEMLLVHSALFAPVELKHRVFAKVSQVNVRDRLLLFGQTAGAGVGAEFNNHVNRLVRLRDTAFDTANMAQVVVAVSGNLMLANQQARQFFSVEQRDIGRPFHDLELSYRPIDLRSLIERAYAEKETVTVKNVEQRVKNGDPRYVEVYVTPLPDNGTPIGVCITFDDVTELRNLENSVERARQNAETVSEELQAANEELQSTNEELETTNEELQSTNEELETMNEELQSSNEELQTINDELRLRTDEVNSSNAVLGSILLSLKRGVVVVDRSFIIMIWNRMAEELWGLRFDEAKGQSLLGLDIGLPVRQLRRPIEACMNNDAEQQEMIMDATNRRGRSIKCRVSVSAFRGLQGELRGAIILMDEMGM
jgi:two-component system, chemotaxis family, CheB/CheR fusion protein